MWLLIVLCIEVASASMIQLRDKNFDHEDQQLSRLLRERMQGRVHDAEDIPLISDREMTKYFEDNTGYTLKILEMEGVNSEDEESSGNNGTRRQAKTPVKNQHLARNESIQDGDEGMLIRGLEVPGLESGRRQKHHLFPNEPERRELKERTMEMMQHQIYATQYRLRDLQKLIDKYSGDLNYRVAYIFCRLETILIEMQVTHSYMNKTALSNRAHIHMIYYTYFMKKNIDVTYIVESMIRIHAAHMDSRSMKVPVFTGNSTGKIPETDGGGKSGSTAPGVGGEAAPPVPVPKPQEKAPAQEPLPVPEEPPSQPPPPPEQPPGVPPE